MKRYKVVNKQRFFSFVTMLLIMTFALIFLFTNSKRAHSEVLEEKYKEIVVLQGDNLWNIAKKNMPNNYDIRYLVYRLKEFNNMETAQIYSGDTIKIPIID